MLTAILSALTLLLVFAAGEAVRRTCRRMLSTAPVTAHGLADPLTRDTTI